METKATRRLSSTSQRQRLTVICLLIPKEKSAILFTLVAGTVMLNALGQNSGGNGCFGEARLFVSKRGQETAVK